MLSNLGSRLKLAYKTNFKTLTYNIKMGSSQSQSQILETTITSCTNINGDTIITCNPPIDRLILTKRHDNFINLRNKIELNKTFKITYKYYQARSYKMFDYHIENIEDCDIQTISSSFKGFVNMAPESDELSNYKEAIFNSYICAQNGGLINFSTMRFLTTVDYELNKDYLISYVKFYSDNFYLITDVIN